MTTQRAAIFIPAALLTFAALAQAHDQAPQSASAAQKTTDQKAAQHDSSASKRSSTEKDVASADAATSDNSGEHMAQAAVPAVITMLVLPAQPLAGASPDDSDSSKQASQAATAGGCWAKLYGAPNYQGDTFTLVGPVDMSNMKGPFGADWSDVHSIKTGPKAKVTIYDNINFRDRAAQIKAGQDVPELSRKLGFFEDVSSMRIDCQPGSAG
jgi:hypothetical protein